MTDLNSVDLPAPFAPTWDAHASCCSTNRHVGAAGGTECDQGAGLLRVRPDQSDDLALAPSASPANRWRACLRKRERAYLLEVGTVALAGAAADLQGAWEVKKAYLGG
jgi:hypothetical protein